MNIQLLFIREHHLYSIYIFWPDFAGCHYSKQTVAWIGENVKFKYINPPNVPQAHLIEIFGTVWHKKFTRDAKTEQQLIRRIESKMTKFDTHFMESLLGASRQKSDP